MIFESFLSTSTCSSSALLLSFLLLFLVILYAYNSNLSKNGSSQRAGGKDLIPFRNMPSPRAYPIVGHLTKLGPLPHLALTKWSKQYGPLMRIKMGFNEVLIISGMKTIKETLRSNDFAGRPDLETSKLISEGLSLTFSDYSPMWEHQKIAAKAAVNLYTTGRDPTKRSVMESSAFKYARNLVTELLKTAAKQNGDVNPRDEILVNASCAICKVCFGEDFNKEDENFNRLLSINRSFDEAMTASQPVNFWPVLKHFPIIANSYQNLKTYSKSYWNFVTSMLESHWKTYDGENMRDLVDCLYYESERDRCNNNGVHKIEQNGVGSTQKPPKHNSNDRNCYDVNEERKSVLNASQELDASAELETKKRIAYNAGDIFGAGYDTVFTMIHWTFLYMAVYPETQNKIREEIDDVIPPPEQPSFRLHGNKCPYTIAWMYELLRHCTPSPMLVPHCTTRSCTIGNYQIPAGVTVYHNIWQAHRDPQIWESPEEFNPQRFLNKEEDGNYSLKQNCTNNILAWGLGVRKCLGHVLSKHQLFIFISTIVRHIVVKPAKPGIEPTLPWPVTFGLTLKPKEFEVNITER